MSTKPLENGFQLLKLVAIPMDELQFAPPRDNPGRSFSCKNKQTKCVNHGFKRFREGISQPSTLPPTNMEVQEGPFQEESCLSTGALDFHVSCWWVSISDRPIRLVQDLRLLAGLRKVRHHPALPAASVWPWLGVSFGRPFCGKTKSNCQGPNTQRNRVF